MRDASWLHGHNTDMRHFDQKVEHVGRKCTFKTCAQTDSFDTRSSWHLRLHCLPGMSSWAQALTLCSGGQAEPVVPGLAGELGAELLPQLAPHHPAQAWKVGCAELHTITAVQTEPCDLGHSRNVGICSGSS